MGQFDKGIALMEQGIDKGDLKHPDDAKLHLGMAYLQADKKSKALQTFKAVQGTDGTSELAHLWAIAATHPLN
jgi:Tfp pilus assembly protein PilF